MTPFSLVDAYQISEKHIKVVLSVSCGNLCGEKITPTKRTVISLSLFLQTSPSFFLKAQYGTLLSQFQGSKETVLCGNNSLTKKLYPEVSY